MLRGLRPDLQISHFTHTPVGEPRLLPAAARRRGRQPSSRHARRRPAGFSLPPVGRCLFGLLRRRLGADVTGDEVDFEGRRPRWLCTRWESTGRSCASGPQAADVASRVELLAEQVDGRRLLLRIDRTELSKNIVRGLEAYRELLRGHPELHGEVTHLAFAYPSRHDLPEYREYTAAVQRIAYDISEEFGRPGWEPVRLEVSDDFPRSLAAYALADVLVVNPVRDGMNLVAKEGPVLSQRDLSLVLSREAGAVAELGADSFVVNPYDVTQTSEAMWDALELSAASVLPGANGWLRPPWRCRRRSGSASSSRRSSRRRPSAERSASACRKSTTPSGPAGADPPAHAAQ